MELQNERTSGNQVVIIGGGPAGLTAAQQLTEFNLRPIVLEKRDQVGGISCTESYNGFRFDMGGHRFFTKSKIVNQFWYEILGDNFLRRRIHRFDRQQADRIKIDVLSTWGCPSARIFEIRVYDEESNE